MTYTEKAGARIAPLLDPGERLIAAARFQIKGAMATAGGLAGYAVQAARSKGDRKAAADVGMTLPTRGIFAVTDRRALVLSTTAWAGRPKAISSAIPTANLVRAEATGTGLAPALKRIRLDFDTGGSSEIDIIKRDGADELVAALNGVAGR